MAFPSSFRFSLLLFLCVMLTGQIFAIFIVAVAAAEVAVGIAIVISMYRHRETVFITDVSEMRH